MEIQILAPIPEPTETESESEAQKSVLMSLTGDSDQIKSLKITDIKSKIEIFVHGVQHVTQQDFQIRLISWLFVYFYLDNYLNLHQFKGY